jgi:RNA polymerase sigma-70 factor (sigma-E family)
VPSLTFIGPQPTTTRDSLGVAARRPRSTTSTESDTTVTMPRQDLPVDQDAELEFERFVQQHGATLSQLAYLLIGDTGDADDLAADVLLAAWRQWATVRSAEYPLAYLRRTTANLAANRIRRLRLGRAKLLLFRAEAAGSARPPDGQAVDVRRALARLPKRRRACVVLRLAFDLSEREVARTLRISVGTVKSQTSKGVAQLRDVLGDDVLSDDHGANALSADRTYGLERGR